VWSKHIHNHFPKHVAKSEHHSGEHYPKHDQVSRDLIVT